MKTTERHASACCPARLLARVDDEVARTCVALDRVPAAQRRLFVRTLLGAAEDLAGCARRDAANPECRRCGRLAARRGKRAALILRAERAEESGHRIGLQSR